MALLVTDCPHCSTAMSGMQVFGSRPWPREFKKSAGLDGRIPVFRWDIAVAAQCQNCHKPICAWIHGGKPQIQHHYETFLSETGKQLLGPGNITDLGYEVRDIWPRAPQPEIPAHVPAAVERAMLQAEKNHPIHGNEEAAAMMYRRALELTLGDLHPTTTGTLAARIKKLVKDKTLPEAMGAWADEIRQLGNEAAHDPSEVSRKELQMIRGFTDATLRYLYTLPAEINARRKTPANA